MNFLLPHRNLGSTSRQPNRNPFPALSNDRLYYLADLRWWLLGAKGREMKRAVKETRVRAGDLGGGGAGGGWWLPATRPGKRNGESTEGRGGRRLAANWISRKTWPPPGTPACLYGENHDTTASHNTYYSRFVKVVALGNDVFLECRHRRRADDKIPDVEGSDYSGFSSSRTTRRSRMLARQRRGWFHDTRRKQSSFARTLKGLRLP